MWIATWLTAFILTAVAVLFFWFIARWHVVWAICWRNLKNYFNSILGYLFIVVFVSICALLTFSSQFFADNQANLDQLTRYFPLLLLFFVPAVTMSIWADEKRQGTDAILFTLPATDLEILLGKYFAVVATYTIALFFSLGQVVVLEFISDPDLGVISSTYIGYWFAGIALLAIGMFASSLTGSATVAFVLGALLCAGPVLIAQYFSGNIFLQQLSVQWHLRDFALGLISLPSLVYFIGITIFMLYSNMVVITKRHWSRGAQNALTGHFAVRTLALGIGSLAVFFTCERLSSFANTRLDLTAQKLYTVDEITKTTIETAAANDRPATIQAFISKDVPRQYVNARKYFLGLLRQFDRVGPNIHVEIVSVEPNSTEEKQAKTLGIEPKTVRTDIGGRIVEQDVYMGAHISSTRGDVVLPFIENSSVEYEITRALAATTEQNQQITVGVLETDAHFDGLRFKVPVPGDGGMPEMQEVSNVWNFERTLQELGKHYQLAKVSVADLATIVRNQDQEMAKATQNDKKLDEKRKQLLLNGPDVLLVAAPSSLSQLGMNQLVSYVELGKPVLILADPLPFFRWTYLAPDQLGVIGAPRQPRVQDVQADFAVLNKDIDLMQLYMPPQRRLPPPGKADGGTASSLLSALGIEWDNGETVWHTDWPHVGFQPTWPTSNGDTWPERYGPRDNMFVFVKRSGNHDPFGTNTDIGKATDELLFFYPGVISKAKNSTTEFEPLVTVGIDSGTLSFDELTEMIMREETLTNRFGQPEIDRETGEPKVVKQPVRIGSTRLPLVLIRKKPDTVRIVNLGTIKLDADAQDSIAVTLPNYKLRVGDNASMIRKDGDNNKIFQVTSISVNGNPVDELAAGITGQVTFDQLKEFDKDDEIQFFGTVAKIDDEKHNIAARISGKNARNKTVNAIFIADTDFLSDLYFEQQDRISSQLDNVAFLQNSIELLAGKTDFVHLRGRRPRPRTLTGIEKRVAKFRAQRYQEQLDAEKRIAKKLNSAQLKLDRVTKEIVDREDLSVTQQIQQASQSSSREERKIQIEKEKYKAQLAGEIATLKTTEKQQIQRLENLVRCLAVGLTPLPAILLGLIVLINRTVNENRSVNPSRRV